MPQRDARSSRPAGAIKAPVPRRSSPPTAPGGAPVPTPSGSASPGYPEPSARPRPYQDPAQGHAPSTPEGRRGAVTRALRSMFASVLPCPACNSGACGAEGVCSACAALLKAAVAALPPPSGRTLWLGPHAGILRRLVHALKYGGAPRLAPLLAELMHMRLSSWNWRPRVVCHVPTTQERRRRRGYDQAELLARALAQAAGLRHEPLITRQGSPVKLTSLGRAARAAGLIGAFHAAPARGGTVLLVDDVLTTGASLAAASRALAAAGASEVRAAVVARTAPAHEESAELSAALALIQPAASTGQVGSEGGHHGRHHPE